MQILMTMSILLLIASATDVAVSDSCSCEKLLSQADCKSKSGCNWSTTTSLCSKKDSGSSSTEGYCGLISEANTCAKTRGCAYIDSVCQIFAGCSAYKGATDAECQAISKQCNSDGQAFCVDPGACSTYKTQEDCTGKGSSGGSGACVWDTACREQKCTEADATFNTDAQCNNFIKGCVTTGKGCVSSLGLCSSYTGDVESCEGLKGSDGYCKGQEGKDKCIAKVCTDAEVTLITDTACAKYQVGCVTNGYGCVKSPLGSCSSQTGDNVVCANKVGSDGKCKGVAEGKTCSVVECKDAPETYSTDDECSKYKVNCVTTGKGCTTSRGACSSYKGTSSTCDGYIGSDGKCKGASDAEAACSAKVCKDADATLDTDDKCNDYQTGCKTTGKGCISTLSTCSSYTGDSTSCDGYKGTDGKCAGGASSGSCFPKKCSDAPASLTTNEDCNNYQTGCISTGTGGCMDAGACSTLVNNSQCDGKSTCQWTPQCIQNVNCIDLKTEVLCKTVALQNSNTCWWVSNACVARTCDQAPATYNTDSMCDAFLKGCLTKKTGCIAASASCTSYQGTKATCEAFTIKCTNSASATDTTNCTDPVCTDNTDATSDDACKLVNAKCVTKGTGCIAVSATCSSYPGTSTDICGKFKGTNQTIPCWWKNGSSTCSDKACTDADNTNTTDDLCDKFLKGCVTTGAGCVSNSQACTSYSGLNQAGCFALSKGCIRRETCTGELACSGITGATNQASCDAVLPNRCMFVNNACVTIGNCSTYNGSSLAACKDLVNGSGAKCYWVSNSTCVDRSCGQITNPADLKTCTDHLSSCARKSDGTVCETANCSGVASPTSETSCTNYHPTCHFGKVSGTDACNAGTTCGAFGPSSSANCGTLITSDGRQCKAHATGSNACIDDVCSGQTENDCKTKKVLYTTTYAGSASAQLCFYNGSSCVERSCLNAKTHLGGTVTSFSQCNNYFDLCVFSKASGGICVNGNDQAGTNAAQQGCSQVQGTQDECDTLTGKYKNASGVWEYRLCYRHSSAGSVAACVDRLCTQKLDGNTDAICQAWLPTCKTNGVSCVDVSVACTTFTGTSESCQQLTATVFGSKCQGNTSVNGTCDVRRCQDNGTATSDADCKKFLSGCITTGKGCIDGTTKCSGQWGNQDSCKLLTGNGKPCWSLSLTNKAACIDRTCAHNTTLTTDSDCAAFLTGCVTKRPGCIEATAECSSYQGVQADCEKAVGNGKSCTNDSTATATTACKVKDCTKLTADSYSESVCQAYGVQCHYNGTKCDVIQSCSQMKGNFITCAQYVASDGPCVGTALQTETPTNCSAAKCSDAPLTLTTDTECNNYKTGCKTNGHGCGSSISCADVQSSSSCATVKSVNDFICTWASQCRDVQSSCSSFTASGQSVCSTSESSSGFGICVWKNSACTEAKCEDLPLTTSSEADCVAYSSTCTYGGAGCVTKGACTSYNKKEVCVAAKSTDSIGSCTWDETVVTGTQIKGCRAKDCQDASNTLQNDSDCDAFIAGCVSNGAGCMKSTFTCDMFKTQAKCLQDSSLQPCLWNNNSCQQYYKCADLSLKTVATCQAASKYCTTDESKCTPLKTCANYTKQVQCSSGTDGVCGWVTSTKKCQLFTQCTDLVSKVSTECSAFNAKCISNGTNCIDMGECSTYADSETACKIGGTDGTCQFDKDTSACRLRQCSDASTSTSTHNGCYGYQINATTKCTTDGSKCISLADCASYTKQAGCVIDSQFKACVWDTTAKTCKTKTCSDTKKTKSSECAAALTGCISDGTKCIDQGKCADYTTKESCSAGGTDGACAFTPASGSTTTGTCKLFSQCSDANSDQTACQTKSLTCKWTAAAGTTASSCSNHTCDSAAKGTAKCVTVPSFDGQKYTVCQLQGGKCVTGDPSALTQDTCYKMSQYTYSWNANTKKCIACGTGASNGNNNNTTVDNNQTNTTDPSTTDYGSYLYALPILVSFIF